MAFNVLVVDDEERIRTLIKYNLEEEGLTVDEAEDAEVAFRKITTEEYDVVAMDINMPGLNGIEGIRSLKIIKEDLPIVVLTGYCLESMKENAVNAGAEECLFKPHGMKELPGVVKRILTENA
ncbi:MAG: response regulator [Planctomycetota bacterium]|jgi:DNA-binding response OmpR family regulator